MSTLHVDSEASCATRVAPLRDRRRHRRCDARLPAHAATSACASTCPSARSARRRARVPVAATARSCNGTLTRGCPRDPVGALARGDRSVEKRRAPARRAARRGAARRCGDVSIRALQRRTGWRARLEQRARPCISGSDTRFRPSGLAAARVLADTPRRGRRISTCGCPNAPRPAAWWLRRSRRRRLRPSRRPRTTPTAAPAAAAAATAPTTFAQRERHLDPDHGSVASTAPRTLQAIHPDSRPGLLHRSRVAAASRAETSTPRERLRCRIRRPGSAGKTLDPHSRVRPDGRSPDIWKARQLPRGHQGRRRRRRRNQRRQPHGRRRPARRRVHRGEHRRPGAADVRRRHQAEHRPRADQGPRRRRQPGRRVRAPPRSRATTSRRR